MNSRALVQALKGALARRVVRFAPSALAFVGASALSALGLAAFGHSPAQVFQLMFAGAAGSASAISETLLKTIPLIFTGLAVALAFRAGLWNIGADGQFIAGALLAGALGVALPRLPAWLALLVIFLGAGLSGAVLGGLAAFLRERRGVSEIITTIMFNFIALQFLSYCVHGPLQEKAALYPQSDRISVWAQLPRLLPGTRLHAGLVLALLLAAVLWFLLAKTAFGFRLRAIGGNARAARAAGINVPAHALGALALSGSIAGVGGAVEVLGVTFRLFENISPGYGFTAIAVALLARLHPGGIVPAAFLFASIAAGARNLERTLAVPSVLSYVIQALVILFVVFFETRWLRLKVAGWRIERKRRPAASGSGTSGEMRG